MPGRGASVRGVKCRASMQKKSGYRVQRVVPMRAYRGRRKVKFRRYANRAKLAVILIVLFVGGIYNFDGLTADLKGRGQPEGSRQGQPVLLGPVTHVRDGDTIEVAGIPVRIANLDCEERGTAAGDRATKRMRQLVRLGPFSCQLEGRQSHDRQVGTCRLADGRDVGETLIKERRCGRWRWY